MIVWKKAASASLAVTFLFGCVSIPTPAGSHSAQAEHPVAPKDFPVRIAVLPIINNTGSAEGPVIVRAFATRKVGWELGFIVSKPSEVDDFLGQRDYAWSGHPGRTPLEKQDPALIASLLGVEGLLHGQLNGYSKSQISMYSESSVKVKFWLTDATGKTIWESEKQGGGGGLASGTASLGPVLSDGSLPPEVLDMIRQSPVSDAAFGTVDETFSTFPRHF